MKPQRLAVLDDEPQMRKALRRLLSASGYCVETYERGEALLAGLTAQPVDCVILDLHMPEVTGFEVLEAMLKAPRKTPAVVLTASDEPGIEETVRTLGASSLMTKPVDESALLAAIEEACRDSDSPSPA